MFRKLREALERALEAATPPEDLPRIASQMREAVIEQKAGVRAMQDELVKASSLLKLQRDELATAERRRELALGIDDKETVEVAEKYIGKLRERVAVLEKKVAAQTDELALAERDLAEMTAQLADAVKKHPAMEAGRSAEAAYQGLGAAGVNRPETDLEGDLLKTQMKRAAQEAAANAKLEEMKKRMGRV